MAVLHQITALKMAGFTLEDIALIQSGADETAVLLKKKSALLGKIAGEIRESYIDGVWNKDDESEWLSELQIPVRKRENS